MVWTVKPDKMEISPLKAYFTEYVSWIEWKKMKSSALLEQPSLNLPMCPLDRNPWMLISWYAHSLHSLTLCPSFSFPCFGPLSFLFFFFPSLPFSLTVTLSDSCISPALTLTGPQATADWLSHLSVSTINSPQFRLPKTEWFYFCLHDC